MPIAMVGGSEQTMPFHAKVMMFAVPLESVQVTRTIGQGYNAVQGLFNIFMNFTSVVLILNIC